MKRLPVFLLAFFLCVWLPVSAQTSQWTQTTAVSGEAVGTALATDRLGNVYLTGTFEGTARFDTLVLRSRGSADIFIEKLNTRGEMQWVKQYGSDGFDEGLSIAVDALDNVYVTGTFENTAIFGNIHLVSAGETDVFVLKLNTNGKARWVRHLGGPAEDIASGISVDANRSVYLTGSFADTVDMDPGQGKAKLFAPKPAGFVLKLDALGEYVWSKAMGTGRALAVDPQDRIATLSSSPSRQDSSRITTTQWGQPAAQPPVAQTPVQTPGKQPAAQPASTPTRPATAPASQPQAPALLTAPALTPDELTRAQAVVEIARTFLGVPYRFAGISREGIDCSGLCMVAYESIGIALPHKSTVIANIVSPKITAQQELAPGDILCFNDHTADGRVDHVGLVSRVENGKVFFIHATSSAGVKENQLTESEHWLPRYRYGVRPVQSGSIAATLARLAPFEVGD